MTEDRQVVEKNAPVAERAVGAIAPRWHTAALVALLLMWAVIGRDRAAMSELGPHTVVYLSWIMTGWMLLGAAVAGVYERREFFERTLRREAKPWTIEGARALGIHFGFGLSMVFIVILVLIVVALLTAHGKDLASSMEGLLPALRRHASTRVQEALAPHGVGELFLWLGVSATAGFCEELVFRGYLLRQAVALASRLRVRDGATQAIAVIGTSLLFGSLHLYEGIFGAMAITLLGCVYAVCALRYGNLRAVIGAHVLQDCVVGIMLMTLHRRGL